MAFESLLTELGLDRYDRNARLRPALLVLLPPLLLVATWTPELWTLFGSLLTLVAGCGVLFLLSRYARHAGRRYERKLLESNGGLSTTRFLRHSDATLDPVTTARYHRLLSAQGLQLPSADAEAADPVSADQAYTSAVNWLRENTRGEAYKMLLDENIDYGFRRNLRGMKWIGLSLAVVSLAGDAALLWWHWPSRNELWFGGAAMAVLLFMAVLAWTFVVTQSFVEDASDAYANRLLREIEKLSNPHIV